MQTQDGIWLPEQDQWGADRLAWEDELDDSPDTDDQEPAPDDPRY